MKRWDVYWADVPYEDDPAQSKRRPVVIAKDNTLYVLTLRVTSKGPRENDQYDVVLTQWQFANLAQPSVVRVRKIAQIGPERVFERIGRLHPADIMEIQNRMDKLQAERSKRR